MEILELLFSWMPPVLEFFVIAIFGVMGLVILFKLIKMVVEAFSFVGKVILGWFMG